MNSPQNSMFSKGKTPKLVQASSLEPYKQTTQLARDSYLVPPIFRDSYLGVE
jgi:hypothetical protein